MASVAFWVVVLLCVVGPAVSEHHSLYYIYTAMSKNVELPGIYEFTALGLLDDREIDYYNSKDQVKTPKQDWMREKMQDDYWEKGTQSRKSKEQWFKVNVGILMERMRHNQTDLHVLQWRHGCEIMEANGKAEFVKGIDEYSYDGKEFLSFDDENMRWIAPVAEAEQTKRKWDGVQILNQYTKGYLEKECVDWLTKFMDYGKESLRKQSPPEVHAFAKKSVSDPNKLTLTCLATGFYPKDVKLCVRKFRTSLPEHLLRSSGVRPNGDETFQLSKSVDIPENEKADYDCYVSHSSLMEPIIIKWDHKCINCGAGSTVAIGAALAGVIVLIVAVIGVVFGIRKLRSMVPVPRGLRVMMTISSSVIVEWEQEEDSVDGYTLTATPTQTDGSDRGKIELKMSGRVNCTHINGLVVDRSYNISLVAERNGARSEAATVQKTAEKGSGSPSSSKGSLTTGSVLSSQNGSTEHVSDSDSGKGSETHTSSQESLKPSSGSSSQNVVPVPQNLRVVMTSSTSVTVEWKQEEDSVDGYTLTATPTQTDGSDRGKIELKMSGRVNCVHINGLVVDRSYNISLVAEINGGRSEAATVQKTAGKGSGSNNGSRDSSSKNGKRKESPSSSKENLTTGSDSTSLNVSSSSLEYSDETVQLMNKTSDPDGQPEEEDQSLLPKGP